MARIVVVEPDKHLASIYMQALEHAGHSVYLAATIERAVAILDSKAIDMLIVELQIAQHNGIELLYELRSYADWNRVRIIIQSYIPEGRMMSSQTVKHLGVDSYLYKPKTSLFELCATVQNVLDRQTV
jgi:DNA-binding response OmpR family regulator